MSRTIDYKHEVFSIPNLMSFLRLILIPVFCTMYVKADTKEDYLWASVVVLISSLTDLLDGQIARRFHMITTLGKVLDPIADKLTHAALAICLAIKHPIMWALFALMVVKEGYMALMGIKYLRKGQMLNGAQWCGKISTTVLFVCMLIMFLFPELPAAAVDGMVVCMIGCLSVSFYQYAAIYRKVNRGEHNSAMMHVS